METRANRPYSAYDRRMKKSKGKKVPHMNLGFAEPMIPSKMKGKGKKKRMGFKAVPPGR